MADPLDLLRLPPGIDSSDPVEGNPFPECDVRHGFWEKATREAEEEACRLNDAFMKGRPSALDEMIPWDMAYYNIKYDIWARRGVRVVLASELIAPWDQWLANYANAILNTFKMFSPPDVALDKLRDALIGRREHWKAEGRRNVAMQETSAGRASRPDDRSTGAEPSPLQEGRLEGYVRLPSSVETSAVPRISPDYIPSVDPLMRLAKPGPAPELAKQGRKRGPKPDYKNALRVAEIVADIAPDGDWKTKPDEVCEELDNRGVPCPKTWRKRGYRCWSACVEVSILIQAIEYRIELANQQKRATPETFA